MFEQTLTAPLDLATRIDTDDGVACVQFSEPEKKHSHGHDRAHDHAHDHDHKHEHDHGHDHAHDHGHAHAHAHSHDGHAEDAYHSHSHSHDHDHDHDHSRHDGVSSVAMNIDGELNLDMVRSNRLLYSCRTLHML